MGRESDVGDYRSSDIELRDSLTGPVAASHDDEDESKGHVPYISADTDAVEISFRALLLSGILAVVLGAANVYLGLFAGLTVSASIPAAIISMSILRNFFKDVSILENNIVQTAASAGESLAAGVIFTIPAMIILDKEDDDGLDAWNSINYMTTIILAICGGTLGTVFSIPIRRALLLETEPPLAFPEGVACANVLKAGEAGGSSALLVAKAAGIGCVLKLFQATQLATEAVGFGFFIGQAVFAVNAGVSAALFGVGYIVGWKIALVFLLGGVCNWLVALPLGTGTGWIHQDDDSNHAETVAFAAYTNNTRFLGVGAMLVGGIFALINMRVALVKGLSAGVSAFKEAMSNGGSLSMDHISRTERDIPLHICLGVVLLCVIPFYVVMSRLMDDWGYPLVLTFFVVVFGFFASAIAAYMAGLVGSSNNPISGVTVCVVLVTAMLMWIYLGQSDIGPAATIYVSCMIACAGSISGDNMQDLKTGHILGATPWKQQVMIIFGVVVSSFCMPAILNLLNNAYGFGISDDDGDDDGSDNALPAPQASLMASVALGVISGGLPWGWVGAGGITAVCIILLDKFLHYKQIDFSLPVLGFAVGFYLPMSTGVAIFTGAIVGLWAGADPSDETSDGVLFAGGLITGEALTGILLAIPIVISGNPNVLHILRSGEWYVSILLAILVLAAMYHVTKASKKKYEGPLGEAVLTPVAEDDGNPLHDE